MSAISNDCKSSSSQLLMGNYQEASRNPGSEQTLSVQFSSVQLFKSTRFSMRKHESRFKQAYHHETQNMCLPRKLRAIHAFPYVSLHHSNQDNHRWRMRNTIILASALHQASQGEPQKICLPYKLKKILTFPGQTQGDDKPYQFSSVHLFNSMRLPNKTRGPSL